MNDLQKEPPDITLSSAKSAITAQNPEAIAKVQQQMTAEETLYDLAEFFKVFGDSTRIRILSALFYAELCVGDIALALGMTPSAISHQLRVLKQAKLVRNRREGKIIYYTLDDEHIKQIFHQGLDHINESRN